MLIIKKITSTWNKDSLQEIMESLPSQQEIKLKNQLRGWLSQLTNVAKFTFFSEQRKHENISIGLFKHWQDFYYKPYLRIEDWFNSKLFQPTPNYGYLFQYKNQLESFLKEFIESKWGIYKKEKKG